MRGWLASTGLALALAIGPLPAPAQTAVPATEAPATDAPETATPENATPAAQPPESAAPAAETPETGAADDEAAEGPLYDTPVYYPVSKSYFELKRFEVGYSNLDPGSGETARWEWAYRLARSFRYKDTRGRLAILRNPAALRFVQETFRPVAPVWIGLRYWCPLQRLQWVDRRFFDTRSARIWSRPWGPPLNFCGPNAPYFGVAIGGPYPEGPFVPLITAWEYRREYRDFLVEYPTGEE